MINFIKNDILELTVENLGIDGEGIARADGVTVFVKGALPGEKVRAKVILVKSTFVVAKLIEILIPSPHRRKPYCPHFGKCGGCSLFHLDYSAQLEYKRKTVSETLKKVGGIDVEPLPTFPSDKQINYRNKISLPIRRINGETKMGFFMQSSHNITDITECPLQKGEINRVIAIMREFLRTYSGRAYDEKTGKGDIRHLVARSVGGKLYITVVVNRDINLKPFDRELKANFERYALFVNYNTAQTNVILGDKTVFIGGDPSPIKINGYSADIHPAGFFQVNDYIRDQIYDEVSNSVTTDTVIDAYSGAGLMTAMLAKSRKYAVGIEINPDAHVGALTLKNNNDIDNMFPINADSGEILSQIFGGNYSALSVLQKTDDECKEIFSNCTVILDPPRSGCDQKVIDAIKDADCPIIYISCNPATLARDLKLLGKKIDCIRPYDMFPQTSHIETLVKLSGKKVDE